MSCWKLYLDDVRTPVDETYAVARSVVEAQLMVSFYGMPEYISFDHDLGVDAEGDLLPSGYDFAKWLVEMDLNGKILLPDCFAYQVHSQNPVGAKNIKCLLDGYLTHKRGMHGGF